MGDETVEVTSEEQSSPQQIDRRLEGDPVQIGDVAVQPVARLTGRLFQAGGGNGGVAGFAGKIQPEEVIVRKDGTTRTIAITAPTREPLRSILMAGIAVTGVCLLTMYLSQRIAKKISKQSIEQA